MTAPSTGRDAGILRKKKPTCQVGRNKKVLAQLCMRKRGHSGRAAASREVRKDGREVSALFVPLPLRERVAKLRAHASNEPGEGSVPNVKLDPSPGPSLRSGPPSPARGEGKGVVIATHLRP